MPKCSLIMSTESITINELKNVFFSLTIHKCPGHDNLCFSVIKRCFAELSEPLRYLLNLSHEKEMFPESLNNAKVTPVFKAGGNIKLTNHRSIFVLPCLVTFTEEILHVKL